MATEKYGSSYTTSTGSLPRLNRGHGKARLGPTFGKADSEAKRAQFASDAFGKSDSDTELLSMRASMADESAQVKQYFGPLVAALGSQSSVAELRQLIPLIREAASFAQKDDPTLSPGQKKHIQKIADDLITFINKKTALLTRVQSSLKNFARAKTVGKIDTAIESARESKSVIARMAGKVLSTSKERDEHQQKHLQLTAQLKKNLAASQKGAVASGEFGDLSVEHMAHGAVAGVGGTAHGGLGPDGTTTLNQILDVDKDILKELRAANEFNAQEKEAREREPNAPINATPPAAVAAEPPTKEEGGWLSKLFPDFGGIFDSITAGFKNLLPTVGKLLPSLGGVAGAAAALWAGWEVGSFVAKWAGLGDSTAALKELFNTSHESLSDSFNAIISGLGIWADEAKNFFKEKLDTAAGAAKKVVGEATGAAKKVVGEATHAVGSGVHAAVTDVKTAAHTVGAVVDNDLGISATAKDIKNYLPGATVGGTLRDAKSAIFGSPAASAPKVVAPNIAKTPTTPTTINATPPKRISTEMHISPEGAAAIQSREGFANTPYWDNNGWAIGYGYHDPALGNDPTSFGGYDPKTMKARNPPPPITTEQAKATFGQTIGRYESIVRKKVGTQSLSQTQFDALVSAAYNGGLGAKGALSTRLAKGEIPTREDFLATGTEHGVPTVRLQARREKEFNEFMQVSPTRSASASLMPAGGSAPTVIVSAPSMMAGKQQVQPVVIPVRITTRSEDDTLRAMQSASQA